MIQSMAHVCISAADLEATERFYCGGLGLSKTFDFVREGQVIGYYLAVNEHNYIEVFQADRLSRDTNPTIRHFCLQVDDIDAAIENLRGHGIEVTDKKLGCDHSWQAWTTDPNGIPIELHAYTPTSCQMTGADCVVDW